MSRDPDDVNKLTESTYKVSGWGEYIDMTFLTRSPYNILTIPL